MPERFVCTLMKKGAI